MFYTKYDAIRIVTSCAEKYNYELAGKTLLFAYSDKHKNVNFSEFSFYRYNFLHLTGLRTNLVNNNFTTQKDITDRISADDFFQKCLSHKLSPFDFDFAQDGTTPMKLDVLPSLITKNLSANMIGIYNDQKPLLYTERLTGSIHGCMGFILDHNSAQYVPNTVLKEDIRNITTNTNRIIAVYRKSIENFSYKEVTYIAKKIDWDKIKYPDKYAYLLNLHTNT